MNKNEETIPAFLDADGNYVINRGIHGNMPQYCPEAHNPTGRSRCGISCPKFTPVMTPEGRLARVRLCNNTVYQYIGKEPVPVEGLTNEDPK